MTEVTKIETPTAMQSVDPMVSMIERLVMDPSADMDKLERMLALKDRLDAQSAKAAHVSAFAAASAEIPQIPMNGKGHNNKPYAELKDIIALTRPVLSRHGLALNFSTETGETIRVTARLSHVSGHVETVSIDLPRDTGGAKNAVQAVGSSQTYGQRYTAQAILGLSLGADTEDDGAATSKRAATISADQFLELRALIERAKLAEKIVLDAERIDALEALPASKFAHVKANLEANIARIENAKQDGAK